MDKLDGPARVTSFFKLWSVASQYIGRQPYLVIDFNSEEGLVVSTVIESH